MLSAEQFQAVLKILDQIDEGELTKAPRQPGIIGRFLRQYVARVRDQRLFLSQRNVKSRKDNAVSGTAYTPIELHPLYRLQVHDGGLHMQRAHTLAISEQLGGLTDLLLWLKGTVATTTHNFLRREQQGVRLAGDYRWTPPARVTTGNAWLESCTTLIGWERARCLKAVADDITVPPHAVQYVRDYKWGRPGLKYFRCVCARRQGQEWEVLPALKEPVRLPVASNKRSERESKGSELWALLIYCEPWDPESWTVAERMPITVDQAFAHAIGWSDFQRELDGSETDAQLVHGIGDAFQRAGLRPTTPDNPNLTRSLMPLAREIHNWLRNNSEAPSSHLPRR